VIRVTANPTLTSDAPESDDPTPPSALTLLPRSSRRMRRDAAGALSSDAVWRDLGALCGKAYRCGGRGACG
jgi:hypothetical protein